MSTLPTKNLILLHDSQNNFKFLVDSGASISILPHSSLAPPTGPHLVGANGKPILAWGLCRRTVCFAGHNFEFEFLLFTLILALNNPSQTSSPTRGLGPHIQQGKYQFFY
jgi:hypothetical protein